MTDCRIETCGVQDFDVEPESVDLILTDPPYPREFIWTWDALAEFAGRVLAPGGSILAMGGQMFVPEYMESFVKHLDYQWIIACMTPGANARIWPKRLYGGWKPILWYSKGKPSAPRKMTEDRVVSKPDKRFHDWGQDLGIFDHLTRLFSRRGDVVCDPFLGGGTTALAVLVNGRRFIGCDVDADAVAKTQTRIDALDDYRRARLTLTDASESDTSSPLGDRDECGADNPEEGHDEETERQRSGDRGSARGRRPRSDSRGSAGGGKAGAARRGDPASDGLVADLQDGQGGADVPDRRARRRRVDRDNGAGVDRGAGSGGDAGVGRSQGGRGQAGPEAAADGEEAAAESEAEGRSDRLTESSTETPEAAAPPASSLEGENT